MKIFIDTNILIDYLCQRQPFSDNAEQVIFACKEQSILAYASSQSVLDAFYILRKVCSVTKLRSFFIEISKVIEFVGVNKEILQRALNNDSFLDFEDSVIAETAFSVGAELIITRNIKDFSSSAVKAVLPEDFIKREI